MLSVTYKPYMLSAVMLNVVMLSVVAQPRVWLHLAVPSMPVLLFLLEKKYFLGPIK